MKRTRERRANFKLYADFQLWRRWGPRPPCCSRVKCIWFVAWTKSANIKQCCQQTGCNRKEHKIGHKITYVIWQQTCCLKRRNGTREKRIHVHLWTVVNLSSSFFSNACVLSWASLVAQLVKNLPAMRETWVWSLGLIPGSGRSPGEGKGYPLQYSGKELDMTERLSLCALKIWQKLRTCFIIRPPQKKLNAKVKKSDTLQERFLLSKLLVCYQREPGPQMKDRWRLWLLAPKDLWALPLTPPSKPEVYT